MKYIILMAGLLAVSSGCFAEERIKPPSRAEFEQQQDSLDQLSDSLTISRNYRETDEERIAREKARAALAKKPNARIGMTAKQVRTGTNWGEPDKINDTIDASGSFQQWVYGDEYLYFKNGKLVSIQTSR